MDHSIRAYRRRLNGLSFLILVLLGTLPLVLAYAVFGPEVALVFLVGVLGLGIFRLPNTGDFPGTYRLAPHQAPGLFSLVDSLARRAGLRVLPEVRFVPGGQINAAATLRGSTPVLVVTEALLARLDTRRLGAVLAHEVAHLAHRDLVRFRVAQTLQAATLVLGFVTVVLALASAVFDPAVAAFWVGVGTLAPWVARVLVAGLSRTREFAADLGSARLTGDPGALADALELIEYRPRTWWDWVAGRRSPVPTDPASDAFRTHPPTSERVRRLDLLSRL